MKKATYQVTTYDPMTETYTPQEGCPEFVVGIAGLRNALRILRNMAYEARRGCPGVLVEKQ